jgi:hypothetical protein
MLLVGGQPQFELDRFRGREPAIAPHNPTRSGFANCRVNR